MATEEPTYEDPKRADTSVRVKVVLTAIEPVRPLTYTQDILPHRDDPTDRVMHALAEVICKHAHKKVTMIGRPEADALKSRFDE